MLASAVSVDSVINVPFSNSPTGGFADTDFIFCWTVTVQTAVLSPADVLAVMLAFPKLTAVTTAVNPVPDTFTTLVLSELHITFLFVVVTGLIIAFKKQMSRYSLIAKNDPTRCFPKIWYMENPQWDQLLPLL